MRRQDAEIPAPDGLCHGTLHIPGGDGPWPGVLVFPDAGGVRETFRRLADRLAGLGYVVLVPDIYYRAGAWEPFDVATLFTDDAGAGPDGGPGRPADQRPDHRRFRGLRGLPAGPPGSHAGPRSARPATAWAGACHCSPRAGIGPRVAAAASFHGGRLAVAGDPSSPHLLAGRITATVYVAGATDDSHFTAEQAVAPAQRAGRRGDRPHGRDLSGEARLRGARQPDLRPGRGGSPLGRAGAALPGPPPGPALVVRPAAAGAAGQSRQDGGADSYWMWRRTARAWSRPWIRPTSHSAMSSAAAAPWLVTRRPSTT